VEERLQRCDVHGQVRIRLLVEDESPGVVEPGPVADDELRDPGIELVDDNVRQRPAHQKVVEIGTRPTQRRRPPERVSGRQYESTGGGPSLCTTIDTGGSRGNLSLGSDVS